MGDEATTEVLPLDPTLAPGDGSVASGFAAPSQAELTAQPAAGPPAAASARANSAFTALAPPLTTSEAQDTPARSTAKASDADPLSEPLSPESSSREPVPNSQAIGRIKLRKTSSSALTPLDAAGDRQLGATKSLGDAPASGAPDSPRNLHQAFDSLTADLDRIADRIHPIWEASSSRRVTAPGEDPEVVVHYPAEWQPSPSERRRLRANWEQATPKLALSTAPETSEQLDDGWGSLDDELPAKSPKSVPLALEAVAAAAVEPRSPIRKARDAKPSAQPNLDAKPAPPPAPLGHKAPAMDSTAPSAVSQTPPVVARSRGGLWGAGLAAAAVALLVWRSTTTSPAPAGASNAERTSSVVEAPQPAARPTPAQVPAHAPTARTPSPPLELATPPAASTDVSTSPPALDLPEATTPPERPVSVAPPPSSPAAPVHSPPAPTTPPATPRAATPPAERDEQLAPSETQGPDAGAVARALSESAARARACSDATSPSGAGSIRVLLNPSGGVLNATALGPFQGTPAGRCVENAFRTARTPAYDGRSLSTVYPFSVAF